MTNYTTHIGFQGARYIKLNGQPVATFPNDEFGDAGFTAFCLGLQHTPGATLYDEKSGDYVICGPRAHDAPSLGTEQVWPWSKN